MVDNWLKKMYASPIEVRVLDSPAVLKRRKEAMKRGNLEELKQLLQEGNPPWHVDCMGKTVLHMAVKSNNLEAINVILNTEGVNVDAYTRFRKTALLTAVRCNHFQAALLLLKAKADIFLADVYEIDPVQLVIKKNPPISILRHFLDSVKERLQHSARIARKLKSYGCSLRKVLYMGDANVTRRMILLEKSISRIENTILVATAIYSPYLENLRVLLNSGPQLKERRKIFMDILCGFFEDPFYNLQLGKTLVNKLIEWNTRWLHINVVLPSLLITGNKDVVEALLETDLVRYFKSWLDIDVTAHVFGNKHPEVQEMVKRRQFNVNSKGVWGRTPLHFAASSGLVDNAQFLLERGANINAVDDHGRSAIFDSYSIELTRFLLERGANVQLHCFGGTPIECHPFTKFQKFMLGHLLLVQSQGTFVDPVTINRILLDQKLCNSFYNYKCDIKWMKNYQICETMTLLDVLMASVEKITLRLGKHEEIVNEALIKCRLECKMSEYYYSMLRDKLQQALLIHKLRCKAVSVLRENTTITADLVLDKIVRYLTYKELLFFFPDRQNNLALAIAPARMYLSGWKRDLSYIARH